MRFLFISAFVVIITLFFAFIGTIVFFNFWNWFAVPALAVPELSFKQGLGLMLLLGFIIQWQDPMQFRPDPAMESAEGIDKIIIFFKSSGLRITYVCYVLLIGYIVHLSM